MKKPPLTPCDSRRAARRFSLCAALVLSLAAVVPGHASCAAEKAGAPADQPAVEASPDTWPMFRGNSLATGVAPGPLGETLEVVWRFPTEDGAFEATAAIDNGTVFVGCFDGNFYAIDLESGKEKWRFHTEAGFKAPAAVRDGRVYVGDLDGKFYCLDAASGGKVWEHQTGAEIDGCPNFFQDNVLVGSQDATLYCLNAAAGSLVWKHTIDDQIRCTPTVAGERAFVAGCDGKLHIIDLLQGQPAGSVPIDSPTGCTPAVGGSRLYVGTEGETFFCIDWQEARVVWTYRNPQRGGAFRSSAALTEKLVVVAGRDKLVHALDPADGREVWQFTARRGIDSSPVVVGQRVYVATGEGRLVALDLPSGQGLWEYDAGGGFVASPAVAAGKLVIGSEDGVLYCFGAR